MSSIRPSSSLLLPGSDPTKHVVTRETEVGVFPEKDLWRRREGETACVLNV